MGPSNTSQYVTDDKLIMTYHTGASDVSYFYILISHGDVIGLRDINGNQVVSYKYDAYGNILSSTGTMTIGNGQLLNDANPFRYASYYYDTETKMYYLNARYYKPQVGRFITRDAVYDKNLYQYSGNNPVMYVDPSGYEQEMQGFYSGSTKTKEDNFISTVVDTLKKSSNSIKEIEDNSNQYAKNAIKEHPYIVNIVYLSASWLVGKGVGKIVANSNKIIRYGTELTGIGIAELDTKNNVKESLLSGAIKSTAINNRIQIDRSMYMAQTLKDVYKLIKVNSSYLIRKAINHSIFYIYPTSF